MPVSGHEHSELSHFLDQLHHEALERADKLCEALNSLHYEGKIQIKRNLRIIRETLTYLNEDLLPHIFEDENIIFPFLEKRIPKLTPMLSFLRSEHNEFKETLGSFQADFEKLPSPDEDSFHFNNELVKLRHKGTYLICLLRNHMQTESESIYKAISEHLHPDEKAELEQAITEYDPGKEQ